MLKRYLAKRRYIRATEEAQRYRRSPAGQWDMRTQLALDNRRDQLGRAYVATI